MLNAASANAPAGANADASAFATADASARAIAAAIAAADANVRAVPHNHQGDSMRIDLTLYLDKGYIGHPYWPQREKLINIQKGSGLNRARSEDKRQKALRAWLDAHELTLADYQLLERQAARPFYTGEDVGLQDHPEEIVIPAHHFYGMCAQVADTAPSAVRLGQPEQIRTLMQVSDFRTGKTKPDGLWERFVVVKSGTGQALSNQRGLRSDAYISAVTARGSISLINEELEPKARLFWEWAGREIGVGASRKMGWGRFIIRDWTPRG